MTLVEFLAPVKSKSLKDICISILYFSERYQQKNALTVDQLRKHFVQARLKNARTVNLSDVLSKSGDLVDSPGKEGNSRLWALTPTGHQRVRELHSLPETDIEIEHDTVTLQTLLTTLSDLELKEYIEEAIKCLSVGALKASVVFLWAGIARLIQKKCFEKKNTDLNNALKRHYSKAKEIKKVEDFAYINDRTLLLAAQELAIFDKAETGTLTEALDLRNRCGHPARYNPGPKKVSSFIEDIIGIIKKL